MLQGLRLTAKRRSAGPSSKAKSIPLTFVTSSAHICSAFETSVREEGGGEKEEEREEEKERKRKGGRKRLKQQLLTPTAREKATHGHQHELHSYLTAA